MCSLVLTNAGFDSSRKIPCKRFVLPSHTSHANLLQYRGITLDSDLLGILIDLPQSPAVGLLILANRQRGCYLSSPRQTLLRPASLFNKPPKTAIPFSSPLTCPEPNTEVPHLQSVILILRTHSRRWFTILQYWIVLSNSFPVFLHKQFILVHENRR